MYMNVIAEIKEFGRFKLSDLDAAYTIWSFSFLAWSISNYFHSCSSVWFSASASVYISTTSRGYTSTETGNPSFECYRSSPSLTAAVSIGRYVYIFNELDPLATPVNPANADLPASVAFNAGNPPVQAYRNKSCDRQSQVIWCLLLRCIPGWENALLYRHSSWDLMVIRNNHSSYSDCIW